MVTDLPAGSGAIHGDEEVLLDRMFLAVGRGRISEGEQGVYVTTSVKCRPSGGSALREAEIEACREHLRRAGIACLAASSRRCVGVDTGLRACRSW